MASTPQNHNLSFKRMLDMFFGKQLTHEDLQNELIVLGAAYDPSPVPSQAPPDSTVIPEAPALAAALQTPSPPPQQAAIRQEGFKSFWGKEENVPWPEDFINDVGSRIWFTYRTGFPAIPKSADGPSPLTMSIGTFLRSGTMNDVMTGFTTDAGWGCMIRTSQSLLANALIILKLGRDWRYQMGDDSGHDEIVSWFIDVPSAPFSIHNFVIEGSKTGKKVGQWFGPTAASRSIHNICNERFDCNLKVYLSEDGGDIYEDDFFKLAHGGEEDFTPMLILCPLRLGVDNVNPLYWDSLKKTLAVHQSVGISGGRERSSHYFFGSQGDYLFYFDPHLPQESLQLKDDDGEFVEIETKFDFKTVHTTRLKRLHLKEMDPSMLIGFLIQTQDDYYDWKQTMQEQCKLIHFNKSKNVHPLRQPSVIEFDDDGFVDLGYEGEMDVDEEALEKEDAKIDTKENEEIKKEMNEEKEFTEPLVIEERRFSEPVLIEKEDLSFNRTNSSQVLETSSSGSIN